MRARDATGRARLIGAQWRKAPLVLRHHRSVLLAVVVAAFLVGLAAASSPFVRSAAASAALKSKLDEFTPFATGLHIRVRTSAPPGRPPAALVRDDAARDAAFGRLAATIGSVAKPVTGVVTAPINATSPGGVTQIRLMARTGATDHVRILTRVGGDGLWLSHLA